MNYRKIIGLGVSGIYLSMRIGIFGYKSLYFNDNETKKYVRFTLKNGIFTSACNGRYIVGPPDICVITMKAKISLGRPYKVYHNDILQEDYGCVYFIKQVISLYGEKMKKK